MNNDYSLLRPFDAEAAKRGEPICQSNGTPLQKFIYGPDSTGDYVVLNERGEANFFDVIKLRMAPLGWCEGRPVYVGDGLWSKGACMYLYAASSWVEGAINDYEYSWDGVPIKPEPKTKNVKLFAYLSQNGRLIKHIDPNIQGWKRVPLQDVEVEVEL